MLVMTPKTYDAFAMEGSKLQATVLTPESVEEFDQLGGKTGLCLASGIDNDWYRGGAADLRFFFCEEFERQVTHEFPNEAGLKRKLKPSGKKKKNADGTEEEKTVFAEGEAEYVRRALPILAGLRIVDEVKVEEFQPIVDRLLRAYETKEGDTSASYTLDLDKARLDASGNPMLLIRIDPSERERAERGPRTLAKKFLAAGAQIVRDGQGDAFIQHFGVALEIPVDADEATVVALKSEAIGWKIKALEDAEAAKVNLASKYGVPAA